MRAGSIQSHGLRKCEGIWMHHSLPREPGGVSANPCYGSAQLTGVLAPSPLSQQPGERKLR